MFSKVSDFQILASVSLGCEKKQWLTAKGQVKDQLGKCPVCPLCPVSSTIVWQNLDTSAGEIKIDLKF